MKKQLITPVLKDIHKRFSEFKFNPDVPGPDAGPLQDILLDGRSGKHVVYWGHMNTLSANIFYGGSQFSLARIKGLTPGAVQSIGRIADAACLHFWKYRKRNTGPLPDQSNLNFPIQFAETDLKDPVFLKLFNGLEDELLRLGYISQTGEVITAKSVHEIVQMLLGRIGVLEERLSEVMARVGVIQSRGIQTQRDCQVLKDITVNDLSNRVNRILSPTPTSPLATIPEPSEPATTGTIWPTTTQVS